MMGSMGRHCWKSNSFVSFRCILQPHFFYSTTTATEEAISGSKDPNSLSSLKDLLVGSLGFSEKQAFSTSTKLVELRQSKGAKKVSGFNFLNNADSVISFLEQKGLTKPQIRLVVSHAPLVLAAKIEKTLKPKLKILQDLGLSEFDAAKFIAHQPRILLYGLNSTIIPAVEALRVIMGSNEGVIRFIERIRWRDYPLVRERLVSNVALLRARGVPIEAIEKAMVLHPSPFVMETQKLKDCMIKVEEKWGVSSCWGMYLYAVYLLSAYQEKSIESKCQVFESFGWKRSDVVDLLRKNPLWLTASEGKIKAKLSFFTNELGYDPGYIVARPALLLYSFEKRVLPRHVVLCTLKEKGLIKENRALYNALGHSESIFSKKYLLPFKDAVPNLRKIYVNSIGSSAQKQSQRRSKILSSKSKTELKLSQ